MNKPKILLFDIETMASLGWFWERYETNILSVKKDWYMLSFAYKWFGEATTHVLALPDFKMYKHDKSNDRDLCLKLWELLNEADIAIAHYGDQFDLKKANARFIAHGFKPVPPLKSIDTRKVAAKYFNFGSNKLNDLGKYFKIGEKHPTGGWQLWLDCAENDLKPAWDKMKLYNKQDVVLLEKVYIKLLPWIQRHPNLHFMDKPAGVCPNCHSSHLTKRGTFLTMKNQYQRYQCQDCGAWTSDLLLKSKKEEV
jgi:hypothetical protein